MSVGGTRAQLVYVIDEEVATVSIYDVAHFGVAPLAAHTLLTLFHAAGGVASEPQPAAAEGTWSPNIPPAGDGI